MDITSFYLALAVELSQHFISRSDWAQYAWFLLIGTNLPVV